jgi:hypothetical protein
MKARVKISEPAAGPLEDSMPVPVSLVATDARAAANDGLASEKRDTPENPLWVINIAMAVFFSVAALVMMVS